MERPKVKTPKLKPTQKNDPCFIVVRKRGNFLDFLLMVRIDLYDVHTSYIVVFLHEFVCVCCNWLVLLFELSNMS